jgi:acyl CoA:acetate/3-ketoacid CoA transferase beta subunit
MASGKPDARTVADQMIVTIADHLRDGEAVATGVNSHIPILAIAVAKIVHGKKVRLLTVAPLRCGKAPSDHNRFVLKVCLDGNDRMPALVNSLNG